MNWMVDNYGTMRCRRALEDAMTATGGMRAGLPKVTICANHLQHSLVQLDSLRARVVEAEKMVEFWKGQAGRDYKLRQELERDAARYRGTLQAIAHNANRITTERERSDTLVNVYAMVEAALSNEKREGV